MYLVLADLCLEFHHRITYEMVVRLRVMLNQSVELRNDCTGRRH